MTSTKPLKYLCPKCRRNDHVDSKLATFDIGREYHIKDEELFKQSELVKGNFISAQFCSACELAFLPDEVLSSIGIAVGRDKRSNNSLRRQSEKGIWEAIIIFGDDRSEIRTTVNELDVENGDVRVCLQSRYPDAEIISLTNIIASERIR